MVLIYSIYGASHQCSETATRLLGFDFILYLCFVFFMFGKTYETNPAVG